MIAEHQDNSQYHQPFEGHFYGSGKQLAVLRTYRTAAENRRAVRHAVNQVAHNILELQQYGIRCQHHSAERSSDCRNNVVDGQQAGSANHQIDVHLQHADKFAPVQQLAPRQRLVIKITVIIHQHYAQNTAIQLAEQGSNSHAGNIHVQPENKPDTQCHVQHIHRNLHKHTCPHPCLPHEPAKGYIVAQNQRCTPDKNVIIITAQLVDLRRSANHSQIQLQNRLLEKNAAGTDNHRQHQGLKKGEHTKSFIGSAKGLCRITGSTHT